MFNFGVSVIVSREAGAESTEIEKMRVQNPRTNFANPIYGIIITSKNYLIMMYDCLPDAKFQFLFRKQ
ncbi:hypothetical protein KKB99_02360, partial [bacterium]|nr:hypothetical protein [bacterium]MBU1024830.1 hypothetical protein [bacterium]